MPKDSPEAKAVKNDALEHYMIMRTSRAAMDEEGPFIPVRGEGVMVWDIDGRAYIDATATGSRATAVGYGRKELAQALSDQAAQLHCAPAADAVAPPAIELSHKLAEVTPEGLEVSVFASGGSEAVETAFKLAKQYYMNKGACRRMKVISRRGAYHGATLGALAATGSMSPMREVMDPLVPGYYFIPPPTCYRCPWGKEYPSCDLDCAGALEQMIEFEQPEQVACFIAEPLMQFNGCQVPPPEYFPKIRDICDRYEVLLIGDEVITGFGRTGSWFACQQLGFVPDIMTLAKAITSGYIPFGAAIMTRPIADAFEMFIHIHTFSGHPPACATALANIRIIETEKLVANAKAMGEHLLTGLKDLASHKIVGDVRGMGLWCAIEFVQDKQTRTPFSAEQGVVQAIARKAKDMGVIVGVMGNAIELAPPLIVDRKTIDQIVTVLDKAIASVVEEIGTD